jgi:hypothetical protein
MFKKILVITTLVTLGGVLVWGAVNRTQAKALTGAAEARRYGQASGQIEAAAYQVAAGGGHRYGAQNDAGGSQRGAANPGLGIVTDGSTLTEAEKAALLYMVEEEKLASDVYAYLYQVWGVPVFQNIQQSESQHQQAVANLLDQYGIANPASAQAGVFTNPDLQALYQTLITQGRQSLAEALRVGALIEETDIYDLQQRLSQVTNPAVRQVFTNLLSGSTHHLSSFVTLYERETGATYTPQVLSADQITQLLTAPGSASVGYGRGSGYRGGRN